MKKIFTKMLQCVAVVPVVALLAAAAFNVQPSYAADCSITGGIKNAAGCAKGDNTPETLAGEDDNSVFKLVTNVLLFIIGAVSVIMLVIGGIRYTISGGDQNQVTAAKNTILYAIIGIVVALLAYAAVNFVITSFTQNQT